MILDAFLFIAWEVLVWRTPRVRCTVPEGCGMVDPRGTVLYIIMRMEHGEIYSVVFRQDFKATDYKESGGLGDSREN